MGNITFDFNFFTLSILIISLLVNVYNAMVSSRKVATDELNAVRSGLKTDIDTLQKKLNDHSERLSRVEGGKDGLVNHEHLGRVYEDMKKLDNRLSNVNTTLAGVEEKINQVDKLVTRMDQFWRDHGNK
jgi:chaperonin cofactor prefoldin